MENHQIWQRKWKNALLFNLSSINFYNHWNTNIFFYLKDTVNQHRVITLVIMRHQQINYLVVGIITHHRWRHNQHICNIMIVRRICIVTTNNLTELKEIDSYDLQNRKQCIMMIWQKKTIYIIAIINWYHYNYFNTSNINYNLQYHFFFKISM